MAVNTDRDQLKEQEENYRQSLGQSDVERGSREAEDYANRGQDQGRQNYYRPDQQNGRPKSTDTQAKEPADGKKGGGLAGTAAGAVSTVAGATPVGRAAKIVGVLGRHKKKTGGGILAVAIVVTLLLVGILFKGFEIIHMMDRFDVHNFGVTTRSEFRLAARALRSTFQKAQRVDTSRDGNSRRTGRMIRDYMFDNRLDKMQQRLRNRGYEIEYRNPGAPDGKRVATGIRRPDGSLFEPNDYRAARLEIRNLVDQDIPAWRVGKRFRYYQLARHRTGWTRKFFDGPKLYKPKAAFNRLRDRVRSGGTADTQRRVDEDDPDRDPEDRTRSGEGIDDLNEGIDAAKSGKPFKISPGAFLKTTGFVALGCLINDLDKNAKEVDKLKYLAPLILGQQFSTMGDQMKVGGTPTVASEEVDEIGTDALNKQPVYANEDTFDEDGNLIAKKGEVVEEGEYWDTSAAWQRAIGVTVDGEELAAEARFDDQAGNALIRGAISGLNAISPAPFLSNFSACPGQNKIVDIFYSAVDFFSGPFGFLAGEALTRLGPVQDFIERAIKFVAGVAVCADVVGTSPRQTANCIDLGLQLSNVEHVRGNLAGPPIPQEKQVEYMQKVALERGEYVRSRGFAYRYFSPENPDSLLSHTVIALPNNWGETGQSLMDLPGTAIASIGNLLSGRVFAQTPEQEFDSYGLLQFGLTDEEINDERWDDPEANEDRVVSFLRYYCWAEGEGENAKRYHTPNGKVEDGCDEGRQAVASHMREYLYCQQLPYIKIGPGPEGELEDEGYDDFDCAKKYHRDIEGLDIMPNEASKLGYENLIRVSVWMSDRYTVENLSQLVTDKNLDAEVTFKLLDDIEACAKATEEEPGEAGKAEPPEPCYVYDVNASPPSPTPESIFYCKDYIEGGICSEKVAGGSGTSPGTAPPGGGGDPGEDTSAMMCARGTDGGVQQDRGPNGEPTIQIRICHLATVRGVNASIVVNVDDLVIAAAADGISLSGSGFRSYESQQALRRQNCPNPASSPSGACSPPTAKAGNSMHEVALAIDFKHNGSLIRSRSNPGFQWLAANAARFGLENLPSEPWHWSTNGK